MVLESGTQEISYYKGYLLFVINDCDRINISMSDKSIAKTKSEKCEF